MVSERKLQANRRNAKRSAGPKKTTRSRYNAQKHGLLSQAAIIETGDAKEDPAELESLLKALWEDLEPEGAMEEILVDRIAACYWRLCRAQRAEVGETRRVADLALMDGTQSTAGPHILIVNVHEEGDVIDIESNEGAISKTTGQIAHIKRILDLTRALVNEQGSLTKDQLAEVTKIYGDREGSVAVTLAAFSSMATGGLQVNDHEKPDTGRDSPSPGKCKEALLALIDREIEKLNDEADLLAEKETLERDAVVLARQLPSDEVLGKILRYETAIDRQMYRALKELRELQAARRARSTRLGASDNGV